MSEFAYVAQNLQSILTTIAHESSRLGRQVPRLVAVSKTFPPEAIAVAYKAGQRHFGENYVQELCTKAEVLKDQCPDIKWHFIGNLQSNKVKQVVNVPNLEIIESVYSISQITQLQKILSEHSKTLNILLEVNTSSEESKGGIPPSEVVHLANQIVTQAPNLSIKGLMTIGSISESSKEGENNDFQRLIDVRKELAKALNREETELELSMGMSSDYVTAIGYGSTNVRVGTSIFGNRNYGPK